MKTVSKIMSELLKLRTESIKVLTIYKKLKVKLVKKLQEFGLMTIREKALLCLIPFALSLLASMTSMKIFMRRGVPIKTDLCRLASNQQIEQLNR